LKSVPVELIHGFGSRTKELMSRDATRTHANEVVMTS